MINGIRLKQNNLSPNQRRLRLQELSGIEISVNNKKRLLSETVSMVEIPKNRKSLVPKKSQPHPEDEIDLLEILKELGYGDTEDLGDDFIVMNGDLLTTLNYKQMFMFHQKRAAAGTIATFKREIKIDFGVLEFDSSQKLKTYTEKPSYPFNLGMGINILNADVASQFLVKGEYLDMPDLMIKIKNEGNPVYCYNKDCFWLDMGCPGDYEEANEAFEKMKDKFLPNSSN